MNGHTLEGTTICVDYWLWTPGKKYIHFLSHLHSDHTYKLNSTFRGTIYTSPFNAWLVKWWFLIPAERVVPLVINEPHILSDGEGGFFNVTLIDANHCPGSVMFLFEGTFGNILYTGDFRYTPKMLQNPMLKSLIDNRMVQDLYLDNTFAAEHCKIPSRKEALKQVIDLIKMYPEHYIVIGVRKIGKEEVLTAVAKELKEKVLVSVERMKILKQLQFENVFTTNVQDSRILAKELHLITGKFLFRLKEEKGPVLTILLTALHSVISSYRPEFKMKEDKLLGIHRIPYSDHSSHQEIYEFVSRVKPHRIHPIVCPTQEKSLGISEHGHVHNDDGDVLELSLVWNCHKIPENILKLCLANDRASKVLTKTLSESFDELLSEEELTQITEEVLSDEFSVGSSQMTEDLSNDVPEIQISQTDTSHCKHTSLVNKLQENIQKNFMDTMVNTTKKENRKEDPIQPSVCLSMDTTITNTEGEKIRKVVEQQSNQLSMDSSITSSVEDLILRQMEILHGYAVSQTDEECEFISLSQEDPTQLPVQQSQSNLIDPKNKQDTDKIHETKISRKKNMKLYSDNSDLDLNNVISNRNKAESSKLQSNILQENCVSDKKIYEGFNHAQSQVGIEEILLMNCSPDLKSSSALQEFSKSPIEESAEASHPKGKSKKRKSVESYGLTDAKQRRVRTGVLYDIIPPYTEVKSSYTTFKSFKEISVLLKEICLQKVLVSSTTKPVEGSKSRFSLETDLEPSCKSLSSDNTPSLCFDTSVREDSERTPEKCGSVKDRSECSTDSDSGFAFDASDMRTYQEENSRLLNTHSPVSDKEEDFMISELAQNIVFYKDQLAKRLGRVRLSDCAILMIANGRDSCSMGKSNGRIREE